MKWHIFLILSDIYIYIYIYVPLYVIIIWVTYIYGIRVVESERGQTDNTLSGVATFSIGVSDTDKSINIVARIVCIYQDRVIGHRLTLSV